MTELATILTTYAALALGIATAIYALTGSELHPPPTGGT